MFRVPAAVLCLVFIVSAGFAQKIKLINSGEVIEQNKVLYDSGKYEEAITQYLTIPKRDTNYVYMLTELAITYIAAEKYDKAIAVCEEGLVKPSTFKINFLRSRAIATDKKGEVAKAIGLFQNAIEKYPFDYSLIYNLGITYYNNKEYDKAIDTFFKVLAINPYHSGSHLNLGRIAIGRGRKTHAMLSFGMYLSVNNRDNARLVYIDKFVSNQIPEEASLTPSGVNGCEKLDQIIKSKIAMEKSFKTKVPLDFPVVRQYELLFEQLNLINSKTDDKWIAYYLPMYTAIKEQNATEPFLYNLLTSAESEVVQKWLKKNNKVLDAFYGIANIELRNKRKTLTPPARFGFTKEIQAWYNDDNSLDGLGAKLDEKNEGRWIYFHDTNEIAAEGNFKGNEKVGIWKYYYNTAEVKSIENYDTGEVTVYFKEGPKQQHFFLKNDVIEGSVETYYASGGLEDKLTYVNGKRSGPGESYYPSGKKDGAYQYVDGKPSGEFIGYYESGKVFSKRSFKDGNLNGKYEEYYANGKLRTSGEYVEGKLNGLWKYYFSNGRIDKEGSYKNDIVVGEWNYYEKQGALSNKVAFNEKGQYHGESITYNNGKVHNIQTYKNDILVKTVYMDMNGKEVDKFENSNGTFAAKTYYASGQLNAEGSYKKGKQTGTWKYYNPEGGKISEYNFEDGVVQGEASEYFKTGQKKYTYPYKDNQFNGYLIEYYSNGKIKREGWYQNGDKQQQWFTYYPDGTLESDYFYLNDRLIEEADDYNTDGKKFVTNVYTSNEDISELRNLKSNGSLATKTRVENGKKIYETFYANGKPQSKYELLEGDFTGNITRWFPDGNIIYTYPMVSDRKHGAYKFNNILNKVELEGEYVNGNEEGKWTGYTPTGSVDFTGIYTGGERDSIWTNYYITGKVSSLIPYKNSERHGVARYNTPEGNPVVEKLFEDGYLTAYRTINTKNEFGDWILFTANASITANHANGTKAFEEQYKNGALEGARKLYYANGKVCNEYSSIGGSYEGPYAVYYPNNQLREKGEYLNDELHGVVETYNSDGTLLKTETFTHGIKNGKAVVYKNGAKLKEINYWAGSPE